MVCHKRFFWGQELRFWICCHSVGFVRSVPTPHLTCYRLFWGPLSSIWELAACDSAAAAASAAPASSTLRDEASQKTSQLRAHPHAPDGRPGMSPPGGSTRWSHLYIQILQLTIEIQTLRCTQIHTYVRT